MFPRWKYHRDKAPRIVASQAEADALGEDWCDSPADFGIITCPAQYQDDYEPALDKFAKRGPGRPPKVKNG